MNAPVFVSWLALLLSLAAIGLGIRIAAGWRDWKMLPLLAGLGVTLTAPVLDLLLRSGMLDDAALHRLLVYRSVLVALVTLIAVVALQVLMEQQRGLRQAAERTGDLVRSNAELEREIENRRKAEQAALDAHTRLRAILDNTPANIFIKDLAGRYLYLNRPRVFAKEGPFVDGVVGKTDAEMFPPDVAAELRAIDVQAVETGEAVEAEHSIVGARGKRRYLTVTFPLRDAQGGIYAVAGVSTDITRQAETAEAVRRVFELSPTLMCTLDARGKFLMVNPAFGRALGFTESELVGHSYAEFIHPDDLATAREQGRELQGGLASMSSQENRYRTRDGGYRTLSWQTTYVAAEGVFYGAATDVTDKAYQREAIRRIYRLAPVVMCTFDWTGVIVAVNPMFHRLLGFTEDEMVGRHYLDLVHPDDRAAALVQDVTLHASETTVAAFEARILCKDGSYRTMSWDVASAPDDQAFYGVARDVTDARRVEQQTAKRRDEMAHLLRLQTIGEMASELSHELNQPLGAVVNFAHGLIARLRAGSIARDEVFEILEKIAGQGLRGGELIRKVLVFARRSDIEPRESSLNDVVRDTVALLGAGTGRATEIVLELDDSLPLSLFDKSQMQQVVFNLVRNALDAVDGRGDRRVTIRTAYVNGSEIRLSVSDNGPGMPRSESERIFDAFYTTRPGGVGLGLSITRSLVQAHEGRLWVESMPGAGTTFHVALPQAASSSALGELEPRSSLQ